MPDDHVAMITPWEKRGGIATYARRFAAALEAAGIQVTPVPLTDTTTANPLAFREVVSAIPADADVVHVQYEAGLFGRLGMSGVGAPAFFHALGGLDRPVVTTLHEVHREHPHRGPVGDALLRARDAFIERVALGASNVTVVHTREAERILRDRHGDRWRIERLLHPVEADADPTDDAAAKDALDLDGDVALTFGWIERKKRYEDVVRALPAFPGLTYVLAGGKRPDEGERVLDAVEKLATDLGVDDRVRYLGYVDEDDVSTVFAAADVVVLPYERVSQSGVVNDALAHERPVVTTALPAFEELRDDYDCLLTYDGQAELCGQLTDVLLDPTVRARLVARAREYTGSVSWEWFAEELAAIYRSVARSE